MVSGSNNLAIPLQTGKNHVVLGGWQDLKFFPEQVSLLTAAATRLTTL
jgi:hypothetical protein